MVLLVSQTRWEFSPLDREAIQPCVLSSYSIIPNPRTNRCPIKAQLLSSLSTKFIVMGPLGLDPIHPWAQSENRDPTIGAVHGKVACAMMSAMVFQGRIKSPRGVSMALLVNQTRWEFSPSNREAFNPVFLAPTRSSLTPEQTVAPSKPNS